MINELKKVFHTEQLCLNRSSGNPVSHFKLNTTCEFACLTESPFGAHISKRSPRRSVGIDLNRGSVGLGPGLELKYLDYQKEFPNYANGVSLLTKFI